MDIEMKKNTVIEKDRDENSPNTEDVLQEVNGQRGSRE